MKKQQQKQIFWAVLIVVALILLFNNTSFFQTTYGTNYDFTHYIIKNQAAQDPLTFGNEEIVISDPIYSESCDQVKKYRAPEPSADCWTAEAEFMGESYTLPYGQDVEINQCLTLNWKSNVYVDDGGLEPTADENDYVQVAFDPNQCFTFSTTADSLTRFGSDTQISLTVDSILPNEMPVAVETKASSVLFPVYDSFAGEKQFMQTKKTIDTGTNTIDINVLTPKIGSYSIDTTLVPAIYYSEGVYKESTNAESVSVVVVSAAVYDNPSLTASTKEAEGNSIVTTLGNTISSKPASTLWMWGIILVLVSILIYNLWKIRKKRR